MLSLAPRHVDLRCVISHSFISETKSIPNYKKPSNDLMLFLCTTKYGYVYLEDYRFNDAQHVLIFGIFETWEAMEVKLKVNLAIGQLPDREVHMTDI